MKESLNSCLRKVANTPALAKQLANQILEDDDQAAEQYEGRLEPEVLDALLSQRHTANIRKIIPWAILHFGYERSISHSSFQRIIRLPKPFRKDCLFAMAHIELPLYQLVAITRLDKNFEPFSTLFDRICRFDCFTVPDMELLLSTCGQCREVVAWEIEHAEKQYGENSRITFAKAYFEAHTEHFPAAQKLI